MLLILVPSLAVAAAPFSGSYKLQADISYGGKSYTVSPLPLPPEEQRELVLTPPSPLKAYSQASLMSAESALVNLQIYETRNGRTAQLAALTLVLQAGREHTEVMDTPYGKLTLKVAVETSSQSAPASSGRSTNYAPVAPPKVTGTIPDEQRSVPRPVGK